MLIKRYEDEGLIYKIRLQNIVLKTFLKNHEESLKLASNIFNRKESSLWVIVISYYSMFYLANAYIYVKGYKVGNKIAHKVTADVLKELSEDEISNDLIKEFSLASEEALDISRNLANNFEKERIKRSRIQYETTEKIKESKAFTSLNRAKLFSEKIINLIVRYY